MLLKLYLKKGGEVKMTLINRDSSLDKQDTNNLKNAFSA